MTRVSQRVFSALATVLVAVIFVSGCATGGSTNSTPASPQSDILTEQLPSDVTARGVLLAAILLRSGDVENALSNGTVTPAEVDRARQAIAEGVVDLWRQRAESE